MSSHEQFSQAQINSEIAEIVHSASAAHAEEPERHAAPPTQHMSSEDRYQFGREQRKVHHREALGEYVLRENTGTALELLDAQEVDRVQSLLPLRHQRMLVSPFTFFRGSAAVMAYDLHRHGNSGLTVQLCGDAHMLNFGIFAAPDRFTIFDTNDFDETHPGPFEWDVQRLLTSLVLGGEERGLSESEIAAAVTDAARQYIRSVRTFADSGELDVWYARTTVSALLEYVHQHRRPDLEKAIAAAINESQTKSMWSAIEKFTVSTPGGRVFRDDPPVLERIPMDSAVRANIEDLFEQYKETLPHYRRVLLDKYRITDIGHKVVGVGSVGLLAFVTLLEGRDGSDLLVLQSKQAVPSVLEPYTQPSRFPQHGQRVVVGQQVMQSASDMFLGWYSGRNGRHFYTRQLRDMKGSINLKTLTPGVLSAYGSLCAATLARAHARSGDAIVLAGYLGKGNAAVEALARQAFAYRDQVHLDYAAYKAHHGDTALAGA